MDEPLKVAQNFENAPERGSEEKLQKERES